MERLKQIYRSIVGQHHIPQENLIVYDNRTRKTIFIPIDDLKHCYRFNAY